MDEHNRKGTEQGKQVYRERLLKWKMMDLTWYTYHIKQLDVPVNIKRFQKVELNYVSGAFFCP